MDIDKLDDLALAFMQCFPDTNQTLSLDCFLVEHESELTEEQTTAGWAIVELYSLTGGNHV